MLRSLALAFVSVLCVALVADAGEIVRVYGPGGPAPAMKEAAKAFQEKTAFV